MIKYAQAINKAMSECRSNRNKKGNKESVFWSCNNILQVWESAGIERCFRCANWLSDSVHLPRLKGKKQEEGNKRSHVCKKTMAVFFMILVN